MSGTGAFNTNEQAQPAWAERATIACDLLGPSVAAGLIGSVSDVGCGDQKLRQLMEQRGWALSYRGFDVIPQSDDVEPLDVNVAGPPGRADAVAALGLIEYVDDVGDCLRRLARHAPLLVVSHVTRDRGLYSEEQLRERGWKNHLHTTEFGALLTSNGWSERDLRTTSDGRTRVWLAERTDMPV